MRVRIAALCGKWVVGARNTGVIPASLRVRRGVDLRDGHLQPFRLFPVAGPVPERDGLFGDGHEPPRRLVPAEVCGPLH